MKPKKVERRRVLCVIIGYITLNLLCFYLLRYMVDQSAYSYTFSLTFSLSVILYSKYTVDDEYPEKCLFIRKLKSLKSLIRQIRSQSLNMR